jgi:hypothetical protein
MTRAIRIPVVIALAVGAATAAESQAPMARTQHATLNLAAGISVWDLSGTGNSVIFAARLDRSLGIGREFTGSALESTAGIGWSF